MRILRKKGEVKILRWMIVLFFFSSDLIPIAWLPSLTCSHSYAGEIPKTFPLTKPELLQLVSELAPKVNLFRDVWAIDPKAEFYGGTSRDFVYWILKHFKYSGSEQVAKIKAILLSKQIIDIREILAPDSDLDMMSKRSATEFQKISPIEFGIRKIDAVSFDRSDPNTKEGQDEINQGFIPIEKMRLSKMGIVEDLRFGDPISEMISGDYSMTPPDPALFWKTKYAQSKSNHPILLALRYIRVLAQDYRFRKSTGEYPNLELEIASLKPSIKTWILETIRSAKIDPHFQDLLSNSHGRKWLEGSITKSFRGFTVATYAFQLFDYFGMVDLQMAYPDKIQSLHSHLTLKKRDWNEIEKNWKASGFDETTVLKAAISSSDDLTIFHGTKSDAFRSILFQGAIPSSSGMIGSGFYAVPFSNIKVAEEYSEKINGEALYIVKTRIKPNARIVDITQGEGLRLLNHWRQKKRNESDPDHIDRFADDFGFDVVKYQFSGDAYSIKNLSALDTFEGHRLKLESLDQIVMRASKVKDLNALSKLILQATMNHLRADEFDMIAREIPESIWEIWFNQQDFSSPNQEILKILGALAINKNLYFRDKVIKALDLAISESFKSTHAENMADLPKLRELPVTPFEPVAFHYYQYLKMELPKTKNKLSDFMDELLSHGNSSMFNKHEATWVPKESQGRYFLEYFDYLLSSQDLEVQKSINEKFMNTIAPGYWLRLTTLFRNTDDAQKVSDRILHKVRENPQHWRSFFIEALFERNLPIDLIKIVFQTLVPQLESDIQKFKFSTDVDEMDLVLRMCFVKIHFLKHLSILPHTSDIHDILNSNYESILFSPWDKFRVFYHVLLALSDQIYKPHFRSKDLHLFVPVFSKAFGRENYEAVLHFGLSPILEALSHERFDISDPEVQKFFQSIFSLLSKPPNYISHRIFQLVPFVERAKAKDPTKASILDTFMYTLFSEELERLKLLQLSPIQIWLALGQFTSKALSDDGFMFSGIKELRSLQLLHDFIRRGLPLEISSQYPTPQFLMSIISGSSPTSCRQSITTVFPQAHLPHASGAN